MSELRAKPEQAVRRAVRKKLIELGFPEYGWKEEVSIEFYPGSRGYADFVVEESGRPLIVVETKAREAQTEAAFQQARAYAILHNPERPIPYLWVATGKRHRYFELRPAPDCRSIRYHEIAVLPTREELRQIFPLTAELASERAEDLIRIQNLLREAYIFLRKTHSPDKAWLALAQYWELFFYGEVSGKKILRKSEMKALDRTFQSVVVGGRAWAYAFRGMMQRAFQGAALGQYLTPIEAIELMVAWADPRPGEKVLDMAFGSGGFLGLTAAHLAARHKASPKAVGEALYGWEKACAYASVAKAFIGFLQAEAPPPLPHVSCADALTAFAGKEGTFDVILTNPPAEELERTEVQDLEKRFSFFGSGHSRSNLLSVAFLEAAVRLLREGGRLGILLPVSLLAGSEHRRLREWLLQESLRVDAIIELPRGAFARSKAASAMSILLAQRGKAPSNWKPLLIQLSPRDMSLQAFVLQKSLAYALA